MWFSSKKTSCFVYKFVIIFVNFKSFDSFTLRCLIRGYTRLFISKKISTLPALIWTYPFIKSLKIFHPTHLLCLPTFRSPTCPFIHFYNFSKYSCFFLNFFRLFPNFSEFFRIFLNFSDFFRFFHNFSEFFLNFSKMKNFCTFIMHIFSLPVYLM